MRRHFLAAGLTLGLPALAIGSSCRGDGSPAAPAATATGPAAAGNSGIEGTITLGPTCPVERPDSPCPDRPYEATIAVLDGGGTEVARFASGADGRFRLALAPGRYTLRATSGGRLPVLRDQDIDVAGGSYTSVLLQFDSGIR